MQQFLQLMLTGVSMGSIYALVAFALNLTVWTSGTMNFATGNLLMFGAMATLAFFSAIGNLWLSIVLGLITVAVIGYVIERIGVRPLLGQGNSIGWMVTTLGFGIILQAVAANLWGAETRSFPGIIFGSSDYLEVFGVRLSLQLLLVVLASLAMMGLLLLVLKYSVWGKAMRAVSEDAEAARLLSINAKLIVAASFVAGAIVAGTAGILVAPITGVQPAFGFELMVGGFVAAILGGLGSASGAMVGGVTLGILEELTAGYVSSGFTEVVAFVVLIAVLTLRPQGLFGEREVQRI